MATGPVVAGWLFHRTPLSVHEVASWTACRVRPPAAAEAFNRSFASVTRQPAGTAGSAKCTSARRLACALLRTTNVGSAPWVAAGASCPTQLSASVFTVFTVADVHVGAGAPGPSSRTNTLRY